MLLELSSHLSWFSQRNLESDVVGEDLSTEEYVYLLVTWAVRPDAMPDEVMARLAEHVAYCVDDAPN
jgi:hypothetical protein